MPTQEEQKSLQEQQEQTASQSQQEQPTPQDPQTQPAQSTEQAQQAPQAQQNQQEQPAPVTAPRINTYAPSWYFQKKFNIDLAAFKAYANRTTGYANLDAEQYFYPGLYAIGAISSLGKTTFVHQLADQIAINGTPVLYFSLEQSAFELFTKSISRRINLHADSDPSYNRYTSLDIRRGIAGQREVIEQINAYISDVDGKLFVVECNFAATIEDIIRNVDDFINTYQMTPVIIIDYLQIIAPSTINGKILTDPRMSVDHTLHSLKSYQSLHNLTVIAICSLNRANYLTTVDFEAFKESGAIEYTADVVWGMQLSILSDPSFYYKTIQSAGGKTSTVETTPAERREKQNEAKSADIRKIELVALKNRYGKTRYSVEFEYEPKYDTFRAKMPQISTGNFHSLTTDDSD